MTTRRPPKRGELFSNEQADTDRAAFWVSRLNECAIEIAKAGHDGWGNACASGAELIEQQALRIKELERDAGRYRWLRMYERTQGLKPWLVSEGHETRKTIWWEHGLDSAIDAAIEAGKVHD